MKRNKNILYISRDHHYGLLFCWKLRQGIKNNAHHARIRSYVAYFWENYFQPHFQEETEFLLSKVHDGQCLAAHHQHQAIGALITEIVTGTNAGFYENLRELADMVNAHIRFEEKDLFPHLEARLDTSELEKIGKSLDKIHSSRFKDEFPDDFWTDK